MTASLCCSNKPTTKPHGFPCTTCSGQCGSSKPPSQAPSLPARETSFHLTGLAPYHSESTSPLCVRTGQMKKCLRFQYMTQRHCDNQGSLSKRISTCFLNQETDYRLIQLHLQLPKKVQKISAHALSVSAETKKLERHCLRESQWLLPDEEENELAVQPTLPRDVPEAGSCV